MKINKTYSRSFLIAASAYRRQVRERDVDFSAERLEEQYQHETHGAPCPDPKTNGYTLGKWTLDVTIAAMREDYHSGLVAKTETNNLGKWRNGRRPGFRVQYRKV